jgi:hypothetical protein
MLTSKYLDGKHALQSSLNDHWEMLSLTTLSSNHYSNRREETVSYWYFSWSFAFQLFSFLIHSPTALSRALTPNPNSNPNHHLCYFFSFSPSSCYPAAAFRFRSFSGKEFSFLCFFFWCVFEQNRERFLVLFLFLYLFLDPFFLLWYFFSFNSWLFDISSSSSSSSSF